MILVVGAVAVLSDYSPDPFRLPEPKLVFMFDKTYLSAMTSIGLGGLYSKRTLPGFCR